MQQIVLEHLYVRGEYRDRLTNVCVDVLSGDFILLLGANGAGKSTLLDVIATLIQPSSGNLRRTGNSIGYIPQFPERSLFGQTVIDEVAFHLGMRPRQLLNDWADVARRLKSFGLPDADAHANPLTWSIGMQRRLAMALTLLSPPRTLLLDEPSAGLDSESVVWLQPYLESLRDAGCTILLSTHHLDTFAASANRVWILSEGQMIYDGTPNDIYHNPDLLTAVGVGLPPSLRLQSLFSDAGFIPHSSLTTAPRLAEMLVSHLPITQNAQSTEGAHLGVENDREPGGSIELCSEGMSISPDADVAAGETSDRLPVDARASLFSASLLALTLASFHPIAASTTGVVVTILLLLWIKIGLKPIIRWTLPWALFAIVAMAVSGTDLHALWQSTPSTLFNWGLAWQAWVSVLPYWCYLQLGQVVVTHMSALEFEGMIDWGLTKVRLKQSLRHVVTITGGMVFRFLPAISQMFQEQMRAVRVRSLSSATPHSRKSPRGRNRHTRRRSINPFHISYILTPLIIRLIAYGETTANALEARQVFTNPVPYAVFVDKKMDRRSIILFGIGLISSVLVVVAGVLQLHGEF